MAIVNYKTDYPLCILINNKEINKDYFVDKDFTVSRILYLDKSAPKFNFRFRNNKRWQVLSIS